MEMSDYLMCVDQCAIEELNSKNCAGGTDQNCATKLRLKQIFNKIFRCALAPATPKIQKTFEECQKSLDLLPETRFRNSCYCLKEAGVKIQCPK